MAGNTYRGSNALGGLPARQQAKQDHHKADEDGDEQCLRC